MSLLSLLVSLAILGLRTRYVVATAAVIVVLVIVAVIMSARSRRPRFDLRDLPSDDTQRYTADFESIEREFVDHPEQAAARARGLVEEVMRRRGFPDRIEPSQRIRDLGYHDREASRSLQAANADLRDAGKDTERLRRVVQHYRDVFYRLTGAAGAAA
jgi:hypothetical protein